MIDFNHGLHLGTIERGYIENLRSWRNNPMVRNWCRQTGLISDLEQEDWYEWQAKDPNSVMYTIRVPSIAYHSVGICGLTSINFIAMHAEFSLYIAPEMRRKGYAVKALKTLFDHGFKDLNLHSIWGETFENNPAFGLFKSLGMKVDGKRREFYYKNGRYIDCHLISLLRSEWDKENDHRTTKTGNPGVGRISNK